jgi:hypothetical protein
MALGISLGPRFARVRVSTRGTRVYGSVGVGPVSYGYNIYSGGSGGSSRSRGHAAPYDREAAERERAAYRAADEKRMLDWYKARGGDVSWRGEMVDALVGIALCSVPAMILAVLLVGMLGVYIVATLMVLLVLFCALGNWFEMRTLNRALGTSKSGRARRAMP